MCPREYDTSNAQETGTMPSVNAAEAEASTSTVASSQKTDQRDISAFSDERWVQVRDQLVMEAQNGNTDVEQYGDMITSEAACCRFLRGAKGNVKSAVNTFKTHLEWRVRYKLDTIVDEDFTDLKEHDELYWGGRDKEGVMTLMWRLRKHDAKRTDAKRFVRFFVHQIESGLRTNPDYPNGQFNIGVDLDKVGYANTDQEMGIILQSVLAKNYPKVRKGLYVFPINWFVQLFWDTLLKPLLATLQPDIEDKICPLTGDWKAKLRERYEITEIETEFGGQLDLSARPPLAVMPYTPVPVSKVVSPAGDDGVGAPALDQLREAHDCTEDAAGTSAWCGVPNEKTDGVGGCKGGEGEGEGDGGGCGEILQAAMQHLELKTTDLPRAIGMMRAPSGGSSALSCGSFKSSRDVEEARDEFVNSPAGLGAHSALDAGRASVHSELYSTDLPSVPGATRPSSGGSTPSCGSFKSACGSPGGEGAGARECAGEEPECRPRAALIVGGGGEQGGGLKTEQAHAQAQPAMGAAAQFETARKDMPRVSSDVELEAHKYKVLHSAHGGVWDAHSSSERAQLMKAAVHSMTEVGLDEDVAQKVFELDKEAVQRVLTAAVGGASDDASEDLKRICNEYGLLSPPASSPGLVPPTTPPTAALRWVGPQVAPPHATMPAGAEGQSLQPEEMQTQGDAAQAEKGMDKEKEDACPSAVHAGQPEFPLINDDYLRAAMEQHSWVAEGLVGTDRLKDAGEERDEQRSGTAGRPPALLGSAKKANGSPNTDATKGPKQVAGPAQGAQEEEGTFDLVFSQLELLRLLQVVLR